MLTGFLEMIVLVAFVLRTSIRSFVWRPAPGLDGGIESKTFSGRRHFSAWTGWELASAAFLFGVTLSPMTLSAGTLKFFIFKNLVYCTGREVFLWEVKTRNAISPIIPFFRDSFSL